MTDGLHDDRALLGDDPELLEVGALLRAQRPLPAPAFRGALRRRIVVAPNPRVLRRRAYALLAGGMAMLAIAAAGLGGVGPLSAGGSRAPSASAAASATAPAGHSPG